MTLFDDRTFENLLCFLPKDLATVAKQTIDEAKVLHTDARMFDCIAKLEGLLEALREVENRKVDEENANPQEVGDVPGTHTKQATPLSANVVRALIEESILFTTALRKVKACQFLIDDIDELKSWKPTTSIDEKGYGTYYRAEPGKTAHSFKVIGEVHEPILQVASVLMELDLYTEWFPFCCEAVTQGEINRFHKSSRFVVQMPWPMSNREVFLVGYGVDDLQHRRRMIITSKSVEDGEELPREISRPAIGKGNTRIPVEMGGFLIEALTPSSCKVSFIMNVDPKIPHVPTWLVNWVSGKMIWVLLHEMGKAAKKAGKQKSKYTERRHNRPDIYVHFQKRAAEIYAHHFPGEAVPPLDGQ